MKLTIRQMLFIATALLTLSFISGYAFSYAMMWVWNNVLVALIPILPIIGQLVAFGIFLGSGFVLVVLTAIATYDWNRK